MTLKEKILAEFDEFFNENLIYKNTNMSAVLVEKFGLSEVYKMELKKREIIKQFLTTAIERTLREVLPEGCIEGKDEDASSIDSDFIEGKQLGFNECRDQMITNSKKGGYGVTN